MKQLIINLVFILFLYSSMTAKDTYSISGTVMDKADSKPLSGATVRIAGSSLGAVTGKNGRFFIKSISSGEKELSVSMIGYSSFSIKVILNENINNLEIKLKEQPLHIGDVVVTANKKVQAVQEVPISMSVIDNRSIYDRNSNRLDDALDFVPGVEINKDNISIRGSSGFSFGVGSRAIVLMDGFPIMSGDNSDVKSDAMPMFEIERIEIVKGAGSALYGAGAMGGVINIITKNPNEEAKIKANVFSGFYTKSRFKEWQYSDNLMFSSGVSASYNQKTKFAGMILSASYFDDQGYRYLDESKRYNIFSKLIFDISDKDELSFTASAATEKKNDWVYWKGLDSATFPSGFDNGVINFQSDKLSFFANYKRIVNESSFLLLKSGAFYTAMKNSADKNSSDYRKSQAMTSNTELQYNIDFFENFALSSGFNFLFNKVNSEIYGDRKQLVYSFYSQLEYKYSDLIYTLGARLDREQTEDLDSDTRLSPKFGLSYKLSPSINLRASLGSGFRAPSVAERFSSITFQGFKVVENLDLKAEKSLSAEIGANYTNQETLPLIIDASVFVSDFRDLIEPTFNTQGNIIFKNFMKARIIGSELSAKTFIPDFFGLETSFTYLNPKDLSTDKILNYRSEFIWYTNVFVPISDFEFQIDYRYKSKVKNIDNQIGMVVKDYDARVPMHIVDCRLIYNLENLTKTNMKLTLNIGNALDYYYTEMLGNLYRTRNISLSISYSN